MRKKRREQKRRENKTGGKMLGRCGKLGQDIGEVAMLHYYGRWTKWKE
jgi:hypothetical protein